MKKIIKIIAGLLFVLSLHIPSLFARMDMQMPELSEEDIHFIEEAQKKAKEMVDALPTEAELRRRGYSEEQIKNADTREKFDREVERLSKMSEEELMAEIEKMINEVNEAQTPQAKPEPTPARVIQKEEEPKIPAKPIVPTNKQQAAISLIDEMIMQLNNFLGKAQLMAELPGKIVSWQKEGKLRSFPASLTWNTLKNNIEDLVTKLNKLKDKDNKNNSYKYLDDFIKDETLYNNMTKIKTSLHINNPKIELSPFGIDKITSNARQATRTVLVNLHEATSLLNIPQSIDKIFEKYEPTAKTIKESEQAAQKKAYEQSQIPRKQERTVVVGKAPQREPHGTGYEYDRGIGRGGYSYTPPSSYGESSRGTSTGTGSESKKATPGAAGGASNTKEASKGEQKKGDEKAKTEREKREENKRAEMLEKNFSDALLEAQLIFDGNDFKSLDKHVKDTRFVSEGIIKIINNAQSALQKALFALRNIKEYEELTDAQKKEYRRAFKNDYKIFKKDFDAAAERINALNKANNPFTLATLNGPQQLNYKAKRFAYFGQEYASDLQNHINQAPKPLSPQEAKIEQLLDNGNAANLNEVKAKLQDLTKGIDSLS